MAVAEVTDTPAGMFGRPVTVNSCEVLPWLLAEAGVIETEASTYFLVASGNAPWSPVARTKSTPLIFTSAAALAVKTPGTLLLMVILQLRV